MKRIISIMLAAVMLLGLAACGAGKTPEEPGESVYRNDVKAYIQEQLGSDAKLKDLDVETAELGDDTLEVVCAVEVKAGDAEQEGEYTLSYKLDGGEWVLDSVSGELEAEPTEETQESTEETQAPTEETEEPTEETTAPAETKPVEAYQGVDYAYSLTKIGTIEDPNGDIFVYDEALVKLDGEKARILTAMGEDKLEQSYDGLMYLGDGLYMTYIESEDVNSCGLVNAQGEVLIGNEAAQIDIPYSSYYESSRYLQVYYVTGETESEEECFIYSSSSLVSLSPEEGDIMYTGYAKVYDVQNKKFVDNVTITNSDPSALMPCGDSFLVEDENGLTTLYDCNGSVLFKTEEYVDAGNGVFVADDVAYDDTGKEVFSGENTYLSIIEGEGGYLSAYSDGGYVILDKSGAQVAGGQKFDYISDEYNDVFIVDVAGKKGLIHADGTVILAWDTYESLFRDEYSIYVSDAEVNGDYVHTLIGLNGVIAENLEDYYNMVVVNEGMAFVVNDGDFTLPVSDDYPDELGYALISNEDTQTGLCGLTDLFTGEALLAAEYEAVEYADGYIYGYKDGAWTVWELNGPEK